jgi:hypothetical protein
MPHHALQRPQAVRDVGALFHECLVARLVPPSLVSLGLHYGRRRAGGNPAGPALPGLRPLACERIALGGRVVPHAGCSRRVGRHTCA